MNEISAKEIFLKNIDPEGVQTRSNIKFDKKFGLARCWPQLENPTKISLTK